LKYINNELSVILEISTGGIRVIDSDFNVLRVNRQFCKISGVSKKKNLIGKCYEVSPGPDCRKPTCTLKQILGGASRTEKEVGKVRSDNKVVPCILTALPLKDDSGNIIGIVENFKDISKRKKAEEKIRGSEERYRSLFENSLDGIYRTTLGGKYIDVNPALVKMLGYSRKDELLKIDIPTQLYFRKEDRPGPDQRNRIFETRLKKKDGYVISVEISSRVVIGKDGKPVCYEGKVRDITEWKRLIDEIKESEKKYRTIFENTGNAAVMIEKDKTISLASSIFEKLSGYSKSEIENKKRWTEFIVKEDLERMKKYHHDRRIKPEVAPKNYEFRFIDRFGGIKDILLTVSMIPGTEKSIAALLDITGMKKAEEEIKASYRKLQKTLDSAIETLAFIVETRDPYTSGHQKRVASLTTAISEELGLDKDKIKAMGTAALIHDIGKINVPASILARPGKISKIEFDMIKTHSQIGYDIVKRIEFPWPLADIILQHHERIDGSGYPKGLKGKDIKFEAKILAVADVVEAMASHRPYRPALGIDKALKEIKQGRGKLYDPEVADACIRLFTKKKFDFD